ncbi:MAG: hypothetical protein IPM01_27925 [Burkholderiaceae bacterium]|nr:hypothetical protein [Burkholderiaceae bacterium]
MNRRTFLASLLAATASALLPVPFAKATPAQVDDVWHRLLDDPVYFEVDKYQTIRDPRVPEPKTRGDIFEDIDPVSIKTPAELIAIAESGPLRDRLLDLADERRRAIEWSLEDDLPPGDRRRLKRIAGLLADPDDRWKEWVRQEGRQSMAGLRKIVADWLAEPIDWDEHVWFPDDIGSMGAAKVFFDSLDFDTLDALGIKIVEGEYPGSTYYAAELTGDVEVANVAAARLGIPVRFRSA